MLIGIKPGRRAAVYDVNVICNTIEIQGQKSTYGRKGFREWSWDSEKDRAAAGDEQGETVSLPQNIWMGMTMV